MREFIWQITVGILGLYLAVLFVPGVEINGGQELTLEGIKTLLLAGIVLGLVNFFIKPIINLLTLPLRLITLGLFGLIVNMVMVLMVDIFFQNLTIPGLAALFWTSFIVWLLSQTIPRRNTKKE